MRHRLFTLALAVAMVPLSASAVELVLPAFALNAATADGTYRSTEVYLVNPTAEPIQVTLAGFLPGRIHRPAPCNQFMSPTRVVPPRSAVLWTASGLATDLGCADQVVGALTLRADGPVRVTGRMVHTPDSTPPPTAVLSGGGQRIDALPVGALPGPTTLLLPALMWHRNPCGEPAFTTTVGFANPGTEPVTVTMFIQTENRQALRIDDRPVALPHQIVVEPGRWQELRLAPMNRSDDICLEPESFDLELIVDGPLAVYGSVFDHRSLDGRTVTPVDLEHN